MKFVPPLHYSRAFSGFIWKVKVDSNTNKLWVEVRNEDSFELNFFWVSLETGNEGQFGIDPPLSWWDSLLHVYADQVCIQHITDTTNPGPINLSVVNAPDLTIAKKLAQVNVESISESFFQYKKKDSSEIEVYNLAEGKGTDEAGLQSPIVYPEGNEHYLTIEAYLQDNFQVEIAGPVAYLESGMDLMIAYHSRREKILQRSILWIKEGATHLHAVMDQKMNGYSRESFFTFGNYLIFIENRINLSIYQLSTQD